MAPDPRTARRRERLRSAARASGSAERGGGNTDAGVRAAHRPRARRPARRGSGAAARRRRLDASASRAARRSVRHLKGLDDLAALLARPGEEVHCLELIGERRREGDAGPVARRARAARVPGAHRASSRPRSTRPPRGERPGRAERAEAELDALVQQLSEAFGLGGRARRSGSAAERARSAVAWRIRAAVKRLGAVAAPGAGLHRVLEVAAELGVHLGDALHGGADAPCDGGARALGGGAGAARAAADAEGRGELLHERVELGLGALGAALVACRRRAVDLGLQLAHARLVLAARALVEDRARVALVAAAADQHERVDLLARRAEERGEIVEPLRVANAAPPCRPSGASRPRRRGRAPLLAPRSADGAGRTIAGVARERLEPLARAAQRSARVGGPRRIRHPLVLE